MAKKLVGLSLIAATAVLLVTAFAAPSAAQGNGSLKGLILDDKGHPVREAEVIISMPSNPEVKPVQYLTDSTGVFAVDTIRYGVYQVEARKGNLKGKAKDLVTVRINDLTDMGSLQMHVATAEELKVITTEDVAKVAAHNEEVKKIQADLEAADASMAAGNFDDAITRMTGVIAKMDKCGPCYVKLGDAYVKKTDQDNASTAYLKAIELGPEKDVAGAYAGMATIYNNEHKLDDASKMSAKANELLDAAGGGNASSAYNQGIIFWNQGDKMAEAEALFRKAVKLDPKMADAQYYLGMTLVNQNKLADAKAPFVEYMKLDPKGKYAADVKDMLAAIK
jgi:tetratricopeptide (TPR) repeat protein